MPFGKVLMLNSFLLDFIIDLPCISKISANIISPFILKLPFDGLGTILSVFGYWMPKPVIVICRGNEVDLHPLESVIST